MPANDFKNKFKPAVDRAIWVSFRNQITQAEKKLTPAYR